MKELILILKKKQSYNKPSESQAIIGEWVLEFLVYKQVGSM
jgi:hypothetical protein